LTIFAIINKKRLITEKKGGNMILFFLIANLYLIDQPDLYVPGHGVYGIQLRFGPTGEILANANVGLFNRLCLGLSYGASNLIGAGDPHFYHQPGIQARLMAIEQSLYIPAVIVGFDNQGFGTYLDDRYVIMSKGLYLQIGKTIEYPGLSITPNLGMNYCFENDGRIDLFSGLQFQFGTSVQVLVEYSPNFNDNLDQNKGFFNVGINYIFFEDVFFQFALRDLLENNEGMQFNRMIKFGFQQAF
jgi:hypothetical protein